MKVILNWRTRVIYLVFECTWLRLFLTDEPSSSVKNNLHQERSKTRYITLVRQLRITCIWAYLIKVILNWRTRVIYLVFECTGWRLFLTDELGLYILYLSVPDEGTLKNKIYNPSSSVKNNLNQVRSNTRYITLVRQLRIKIQLNNRRNR
jgi:hypothetical protein